jgi:hypothetical protein
VVRTCRLHDAPWLHLRPSQRFPPHGPRPGCWHCSASRGAARTAEFESAGRLLPAKLHAAALHAAVLTQAQLSVASRSCKSLATLITLAPSAQLQQGSESGAAGVSMPCGRVCGCARLWYHELRVNGEAESASASRENALRDHLHGMAASNVSSIAYLHQVSSSLHAAVRSR